MAKSSKSAIATPAAAPPPAGAFAKLKPDQSDVAENDASRSGARKTMPLLARFMIFVFVPCSTGLAGLGISYMRVWREGNEGGEMHAVNFDRDFITPFLLSMAFVVVLGFQTSGFSGGGESGGRKGVFVWPKTRRVQRIRRERVIVDDDGNEVKEKEQ